MNRRELLDELLIIIVISAFFLAGATVLSIFAFAPLETITIEVAVG